MASRAMSISVRVGYPEVYYKATDAKGPARISSSGRRRWLRLRLRYTEIYVARE